MAYSQVASFMTDLLQNQDGIEALALQFTILCAVRTMEALGATWDEFDLENKLWIVPAVRMGKTRQPFRVPISASALHVLEKIEKRNGVVFTEDGARLDQRAMMRVLSRMNRGATVHGMRATFKIWASEQTSFANEVTEAALSHTIRNKAERAYSRSDHLEQRRMLMELWGLHCVPSGDTTVVSIRRAVV